MFLVLCPYIAFQVSQHFKRDPPSEDPSWPENVGNVQLCPFAGFVFFFFLIPFFLLFYQYLCNEMFFFLFLFASKLSFSGCSRVCLFFTIEELVS